MAMISDFHRCIFIHIPRTGGTSVEAVLWPDRREADLWSGFVDRYHNEFQTGGLQHLLARQVREKVGEQRFASYLKFSVVRNPFDKAVSQFHYMSQRPDLREYVGLHDTDSFARYLDIIGHKLHVQWEEQWKFLYDDSALIVDHVVRFESLASDIMRIFARLGVQALLPHSNASLRRVMGYRQHYDASTKRVIEQIYGRDLETFGYEF